MYLWCIYVAVIEIQHRVTVVTLHVALPDWLGIFLTHDIVKTVHPSLSMEPPLSPTVSIWDTLTLHWPLQYTWEKKANSSDSFRQVVRKASFIWSAWHPKSQWKYSFYWSGETRQKHKLVWIGRPLIIVPQTFCTGIRNMCHGEYQKYLQNIRKLSPTSFILRYTH